VYFQQDNAAAHTADKSMSTVPEAFENRIISKDWPPKFPDFRYSVYYLWRNLKGEHTIMTLALPKLSRMK
jgi:hypothetical protein